MDKEVSVKDSITIPAGSVVSCLIVDPKSKGGDFVRKTLETDEFKNGTFCLLPDEMTLESY